MPKIKQTGTYRDLEGNQFYYTEGTPLTPAQAEELELVSAGDRQFEGEKKQAEIAERRAELNAAPENKALPAAPQNRRVRSVQADGGDLPVAPVAPIERKAN